MFITIRIGQVLVHLYRYLFIILLFIGFSNPAFAAAPPNDNCASASAITVTKNGYGLGSFNSASVDITDATTQSGETFAPAILVAGQTDKSIWFKFSIATTRSLRVMLKQPPGTNISTDDVGFTVYKTNKCLPGNGDISTKLTPIASFAETFHPCVEPGEYIVQVSAKKSAKGVLFVQLQISDQTGAQYDHPTDPQEFGKLVSPTNTAVDFDINCHSLEDENEVCVINGKKQSYNRSTWHTFTTPAYFDYLAVLMAKHNSNTGRDVVGFKLYKGDVKKSGISGLTLKEDCDSLVLNQYYTDYKTYSCTELERNTTYTLQFFYKDDFNEKIRLAIEIAGSAASKGPEGIISKISKDNQLGKLNSSKAGVYTYLNDQLACNSKHSEHPCAYTQPAAGVVYEGINYNLSTFFTFSLGSMSQIDMRANGISTSNPCQYDYLIRVFQQTPTATCTDLNKGKLIKEFRNQSQLDCLPAGNYTVQVLGRDTINTILNNSYNQYYYLGDNRPLCLRRELGRGFQVSMFVKTIHEVNSFGLSSKNAVDKINVSAGVMKPLKNGETYKAIADTFGCANTVLPEKDICPPYANGAVPYTKAMYREFVVGDSGIVTFTNQAYGNWPNYLGYRLYKGEAHTLAETQNVFAYPEKIKGLSAHTECIPGGECNGRKVCVEPGTYTYATFGSVENIGLADQPNIKFSLLESLHGSPATAQDLGSILDTAKKKGTNTILTDVDRYSCRDNAVTINGTKPCDINGKPATKAIYRQFYLSKAASISISGYHYGNCGYTYGGYMTLFTGKVTEGLSGLKAVGGQWSCFNNAQSSGQCNTLPAGWYTVVAYGSGPTYEKPMKNLNEQHGYSSYVDETNQLTITITQPCESPEYNRPFKAAVDSVTKKPFQVKWGSRVGSIPAYPRTDTTYNLYTEHFDCTVDTPFLYITPCNTTVNRVAYYVFQTTQEAYVNIETQGYWSAVYAMDIRKDSVAMKTATPIQPCMQSDVQIELCKLQPGTYTLVIYADNSRICQNITPRIYIDQVGYSRFDHALNAYDFGVIPADSFWHNGKVGDVNPLNKDRAPSNDFFYCTTGAQEKDPTEAACMVEYTPQIYTAGINGYYYEEKNKPNSYERPRRNLWYTFVVDKGGWVTVKVKNKTIGKQQQYPFSIYRSNVDGSMSYSEVVSKGEVDSTLAKGLTFIDRNLRWYHYYCNGDGEVKFYRDPCSVIPERYYIIVENRSSYGLNNVFEMNPNSQVEVEILLDSVNSIQPKFDHYSQAYDFGQVGVGKYKGATDNYSCATADEPDPVRDYKSCAKKTLWYKFTSTVTGHVRYRLLLNNKNYKYYNENIQLYREVIKGDSTINGLSYERIQSHASDNGTTWAQNCVSRGTYYLLLTGCDQINENVYPEIEIIEQAGDYCSAPVVAKLTGAGAKEAKVIVDCHTIGTDYGEFGPRLTCPDGVETGKYKSSWFRIDIEGKDTLDVTAYIMENTIASSNQVQYRMMTGDCGAMQEQSCVQDALTQNTYECLAPGRSYYIQVLTPVSLNGQSVTGDINLKLTAKKRAAKCLPPPACLVNANFQTEFDCTKDSAVRFVNFSTFGSSIKYKWEFGYDNKTSTEVSPAHFYPVLATEKSYKVRLIVENTTCSERDTAEATIIVPGRPYVNLGNDTSLCVIGSQISFDATSHNGATYSWNTGSTQPKVTLQNSGSHRLTVQVTYNGCVSKDTVDVYINGLEKKPIQNYLLCDESVSLSSYRGWGESYQWNTGETTYSINVKQPGTYWVDMKVYGCTVRDTFVVASMEDAQPLGNDTTVCLSSAGYILNASLSGASSYSWQDGTHNATLKITKGGVYWVDITVNNCKIRDSITITEGIPPKPVITGTLQFCKGDSTRLDAGEFDYYKWSTGAATRYIYVSKAGAYTVAVRNEGGCEASSPVVQVVERANPTPKITGLRTLCENDSITLNAGNGFTSYAWNNGATTQQISIKSPGKYKVTVTNANGCSGMDSVVVLPSSTPKQEVLAISLCQGGSYKLPSGKMVNMTGVYKDSIKSVSGCDSLITTVNLVVNAKYTTTVNAAICTGQTYKLPSGQVVNKSGEYTHVFTSISGCDSTVVTKLTVADILKQQIDTSICMGQSLRLPSGKMVNTSGVYNDTLQTAAGCDSVVVTRLTVRDILQKNISAAICTGQQYTLPSGLQVNKAGIYRDTLQSAAGCDSVVITTLQIQDILRSNVNISICHGQRYQLPSGLFTDKAGIYMDTLRTAGGCDSVVTTTLKINPIITTSVKASICTGDSYTLPAGSIVNSSGTYRDTVKTAGGCDSLIITQLTVHDIQRTTVNSTICKGGTYSLPSGKQVSVAGQYIDTLVSKAGCDSIITTNLDVADFVKEDKEALVCEGQSYKLPSGKLITIAGVYQDTLRSILGCDSLITTLTLTVKSLKRESKQVVICDGSSYALPSGIIITQSGIYRDTLRYEVGCDSLITAVTLRVEKAIKQTMNDKICVGMTYELPSGKMINAAGTYLDTVRSVRGCDSLISTINIQVLTVKRVSEKALICEGSSYTLPSGKQIVNPGTYNDTLRYTLGCDSVITTLTLDVFVVTRKSISASICDGNSYTLPSGTIVRTANTYLDTLKSVSGCDSLITTVNLSVSPRPVFTITPLTNICIGEKAMLTATGGDSYQWLPETDVSTPTEGSTWTTPTVTTMYKVAVSYAVCEITDTLTTTVVVNLKPEIDISKSNDINCVIGFSKLNASGGVKYEWSPSNGLNSVRVANPEARPSQTTMYKVKVTTDKGCVDEKAIEVKVVPGPGLYEVPTAFTPDGDGKNDCFGVKTWGAVTDLRISVFSRWGELLFETTDPDQCWDGKFKGARQQTGVYIYVISANTNCGPVLRKGTVTLIR